MPKKRKRLAGWSVTAVCDGVTTGSFIGARTKKAALKKAKRLLGRRCRLIKVKPSGFVCLPGDRRCFKKGGSLGE